MKCLFIIIIFNIINGWTDFLFSRITKNVVIKNRLKVVFVATDKNSLVHELREHLKNQNVSFFVYFVTRGSVAHEENLSTQHGSQCRELDWGSNEPEIGKSKGLDTERDR